MSDESAVRAEASGPFSAGALVLEGRFRIVRLLGAGGMGEVFLAEQVSLGRRVALKVLRQELTLVPGMAERFRREALLLSSVDHPAVVRVIDFGYSAEAACLVMELVEGETLDVALRGGPLSPARAVPLLVQLAEGLAAIHEKGIVHRDLKPENVLLTRSPRGEQAKLLDFGIARLAQPEASAGVTQLGIVLGTPEYMAPEQAAGAPLDARSDVYSFGVLAFRTLTGALPFAGPSPREFLLQHISSPPALLEKIAPHLARSPGLCGLLASCLEKEPARRPASATALAVALSGLGATLSAPIALTQAQSAPAATPATPLAPLPRATPASSGSLSAALSGAFAPHVRPRNLAVMLTDIKGYTARTSAQTHAENARMLEQHDRLLLPLLRRYHGKLVQRRGDALLATFPSPTGCVLCGMAMQDRLWRHNGAVPEAQQLRVRVAVHVGEVAYTREGLIGEPTQVVAAVEGATDEGEVVFTEAVRLSMNRAEVVAEERGLLDAAGREPMKLYRCVAASAGPPFGGRDVASGGAAFLEVLRERFGAVLSAGKVLAARLGPLAGAVLRAGVATRRRLTTVALAFAVFVALSVVGRHYLGSPARVARQQLREGNPGAAVAAVEAARARGDDSPTLTSLEAQGLHRLKRHDDEWATLARLAPRDLGGLDEATLTGLTEDFGRNEREHALRELVDHLPGPGRDKLRALAAGPHSAAQWGAVRFLDLARVEGAELIGPYLVALDAPECRVRRIAAARLGEIGDLRAWDALQILKATPKKPGFPFDENCGQDEAAGALRRLSRKK